MREVLTYTFPKGYFDNGSVVEVPDGSMLPGSVNMLYDKNGRLASFRGLTSNPGLTSGSNTRGGSRAFVLDRDVVGFLGKIEGSPSAVTSVSGNIIQNVGRSIWFVGSEITDALSAVKLKSSGFEDLYFGGLLQDWQIVITQASALTADVDLTITATEVNLNESSKPGGDVITIGPIELISGEDIDDTKTKIVSALKAKDEFSEVFFVPSYGTSGIIRVLAKVHNKRYSFSFSESPESSEISLTSGPLNAEPNDLPTIDTSADLSTIPQFCKWLGDGWSKPMQVGLPEVEGSNGQISLQYDAGALGSFSGLVQGSRSVRIARKRLGAVSIASKPSNVVTVPEQGGRLRVLIPSLPYTNNDIVLSDGSYVQDNTWLLYFTYKGLGSTATHKLFPLEIPESVLRGLETSTLVVNGNAKYQVQKAGTAEVDREVVIEFTDADLLAIDPLDDAYPSEPCKFIAKLGNVMCLIGTGDDQTGFDVSIPNNFEGYNPEWRDWLGEVPVSIAVEQDLGFFWILTSNNVYMAEWTGVTEGAAPVILRKVSSLHGAIGESASVCVNGILYLLTRGKTPVVINPQGQSNNQVGAAVQQYFYGSVSNVANFDENTKISWDEASNSVVFAGNNGAIALQIATGLWSAPISLSGNKAEALVPINGFLNVCQQNELNLSSFKTSEWNKGTNAIAWKLVSNFQFGKSGRALKDIIQVEAVISPSQTDTITFNAYKNYDTSVSEEQLTSIALSNTKPLISIREYTESIDYDNISAVISGTKGGQTVNSIMYTVQVHNIERQG